MTVTAQIFRPRQLVFGAVALLITLGASAATGQTDDIDFATTSLQLARQGQIVLGNGDTYSALNLYEQAIVADPKNANAYVGLGRAHIALEKRSKGLKYFGIALEIEPTNLGALEGQALAYLSGDEVAEAERALTKIRRICADDGCAEEENVTDAIAGYLEEHVAENKG